MERIQAQIITANLIEYFPAVTWIISVNNLDSNAAQKWNQLTLTLYYLVNEHHFDVSDTSPVSQSVSHDSEAA